MVVRVLSVPANHVYIRHLSSPRVLDGVRRLPDPRPPGGVPDAQWWPPPALEPGWVARHHDTFDLVHLHFGFDARTPEELSEWLAELAARGKPFVYTVHDLRNPHHEASDLHDAQLDVLVPAADALVTLTPGAADDIRRRWGRDAIVLPHPHVVPEPALSRPRPERDDFVVGVHLKSLRASMDPVPVVETLAKIVPDLPGARLRVDVHTDVMTPGMPNHDRDVADLLQGLHGDGGIELEVHDYFTDEELWDYLLGLDVSVLPYRFGTHSGWLEACYDLGTTVLAPECGYYRQQRPCLTYHFGPLRLDVASLQRALQYAYQLRPRWRAVPAVRRSERDAVARAHQQLYAEVLGR
jgi:hypothetical protein